MNHVPIFFSLFFIPATLAPMLQPPNQNNNYPVQNRPKNIPRHPGDANRPKPPLNGTESSPEARERVAPPAIFVITNKYPETKKIAPYEVTFQRAKNNIFLITFQQQRMDPRTGHLIYFYMKFRYNGNNGATAKIAEYLPLE